VTMSERCPFCGKVHEESMRLGGFPIAVCEKTPNPPGFYIFDRAAWECTVNEWLDGAKIGEPKP
jgi:hypothetical protein